MTEAKRFGNFFLNAIALSYLVIFLNVQSPVHLVIFLNTTRCRIWEFGDCGVCPTVSPLHSATARFSVWAFQPSARLDFLKIIYYIKYRLDFRKRLNAITSNCYRTGCLNPIFHFLQFLQS